MNIKQGCMSEVTYRSLLLSDSPDELYATDSAPEQDQSGLTTSTVLAQRRTLATVITMAGVPLTALIKRTCP